MVGDSGLEPDSRRAFNDPLSGFQANAWGTGLEPWIMASGIQFLSVVPEPSTWLMMIAGFLDMGMLALHRWRQFATVDRLRRSTASLVAVLNDRYLRSPVVCGEIESSKSFLFGEDRIWAHCAGSSIGRLCCREATTHRNFAFIRNRRFIRAGLDGKWACRIRRGSREYVQPNARLDCASPAGGS